MLRQTFSVLAWAAMVLAAFLRFQPATTIGLIVTLAIANAVRVLTIFVPIKVLLLAGSEQIPHYLQPYINDDQRYLFIVILSAGLVVLYTLLVGLDLLSGKLAHSGGLSALRRANQMALNSREGVEAPRYFNKFCTIAANIAFATVGVLVLVVIQPALAAISILGILASYALTNMLVAVWDMRRPGAATKWLTEKLSGYLATTAALNLLLGLFVLLALFLSEKPQNVLITFLSFLILRQCLNLLKPTVTALITLAGKRDLINPLVFRRHRAQSTTQTQTQYDQELAKTLAGSSRQLLLARLLEASRDRCCNNMTLDWIDPTTPGIYQFVAVAQPADDSSPKHYEVQVFTDRTLPLAEHEEFLFSHLDRAQLQAPPVLATTADDGFYSRLLDSGVGQRPSGTLWKKRLPDLIVSTWSVAPPKSLFRAFRTSREMIYGRVTDSLLKRASIAVDNKEEAECLEQLRARLPQLQGYLETLPIIVHNPLLTPARAWLKDDDDIYLVDWTRWSLEPIGFGLPAATKDAEIQQLIDRLLAERKFRGSLSISDIRLIQAFQSLEQQSARQAYKAVLVQAKQLVASLAA